MHSRIEENEKYIYLDQGKSFFSKQAPRSILNIAVDIGLLNINFSCSGMIAPPGNGAVTLNCSVRKKPNAYHNDLRRMLIQMLDIVIDNEDERHILFKKVVISTHSKNPEKNIAIVLEKKIITASMIRSAITDLAGRFRALHEKHYSAHAYRCTIS